MTYCQGWIDGNEVYLVADAVATRSSPTREERSSFQELHQQTASGYTEECLLKVVPLSDSCAVAISGDIRTISNLLDFLKDALASHGDIAFCLEAIHASVGPFSPEEFSELLVASYENGGPRLRKWNTVSCGSGEQCVFALSGSLTWPSSDAPRISAEIVSESQEVPPVKLLMVIASLQSLGTHENLMAEGVGGAFHGLYIGADGRQWQSDARYVVYGPTGGHSWTAVAVRDDVLILANSGTHGPYCFMSKCATPDWRVWLKKWNHSAAELMASDDFNFWIFLSSKWMFATIVYWHPDAGLCNYFKLVKSSSGAIDLVPTVSFAEYLNAPYPTESQNSSGRFFAVRVLNGEQ